MVGMRSIYTVNEIQILDLEVVKAAAVARQESKKERLSGGEGGRR